MMQTWVVRVCVQHKQPFWMGDFRANGRAEAKREARLFVSAHLPLAAHKAKTDAAQMDLLETQ